MIKTIVKRFKKGRRVYFVPLAFITLCFCATPQKPKQITHAKKVQIPNKVAVLPVTYGGEKGGESLLKIDPDSDEGLFVSELVRGIIQNHLSGKGYATIIPGKVDNILKSYGDAGEWHHISSQELCKALGTDGLVFPVIISASMVKAVAFNQHKIEAQIKMVNSHGKELGTWTDTASKRKVSIPTGVLSAAATVLEAILNESTKKEMRHIIYDWGWKIAQSIPDSPYRKGLPKIISVETNIDKGLFSSGTQIAVELTAEEDLTCTFDLGTFKKAIPMSAQEGGLYKGIYVAQDGDKTSSQPLIIHLTRPNGTERIWVETGGAVSIDAIAPPAPYNLKAEASREGIALSWGLPDSEDLEEFTVERSSSPAGDFTILANTKDVHYLDASLSQGGTYYYRIRSGDKIGNRSLPTKTIKETMPIFDEAKLPGVLKGELVPGAYLVDGDVVIPEGVVLKIGSGSKFNFLPGSKITTKGTLKAKGSPRLPTVFQGEQWQGLIAAPGGRIELSHVNMNGCAPCLEATSAILQIFSVSINGKGRDCLAINKDCFFEIEDLQVIGGDRGIVLNGGKGKIRRSNVTKNNVGLEYLSGLAQLENNNIFENINYEVISHVKLILDGNYLGSSSVKGLKLDGDIQVKSLFDGPYPQGRKIILIADKDITPEEIEEQFNQYKDKGIEAFTQRRFGDAHQSLTKALSLKDDRDVYLYLIYTQMTLGEESKIGATFNKAIETFPYEVRLYNSYVKYLASKNEIGKALAVMEKALRMNPDDTNMMLMKEYLEGMDEKKDPLSKINEDNS